MAIDGNKISALPAATSPNDTDVLAGVQGGSTKKFSLSTLRAWIKSTIGLTAEDVGAIAVVGNTTPTTLTGILKGNGTTVSVQDVDVVPTANSENPIASGGVAAALSNIAPKTFTLNGNSTATLTVPYFSAGFIATARSTVGHSTLAFVTVAGVTSLQSSQLISYTLSGNTLTLTNSGPDYVTVCVFNLNNAAKIVKA